VALSVIFGNGTIATVYAAEILRLLREAASFLTEELAIATAPQPTPIRLDDKLKPGDRPSTSAVLGDKVFIVHGHADAALHEVARFIGQLGLEPIVLREQPDQGRTIIEKFEDSAGEVGFAVVIMTPDDVVTEPASAVRARQNVIYELGYFTGKLSRGRACLLRRGNVEIPSDLYGVIYIELDNYEGWKRRLARELKAAGFKINAEGIL
jgi:predicted nucleotide-binding protein